MIVSAVVMVKILVPYVFKAGEILGRLKEWGITSFRMLFKGSRSRSEVVATFMAVLEMMARGEVHITQGDTFAPIRIHMRQLREDGEDTVYMDEEEALPTDGAR